MQVDMIRPASVSRNTNRTSFMEDNINADVTAVDQSFPRLAEKMAMHDLVIPRRHRGGRARAREPRTPAGKARVLDARKWLRERDRLSAGAKEIRTLGPTPLSRCSEVSLHSTSSDYAQY